MKRTHVTANITSYYIANLAHHHGIKDGSVLSLLSAHHRHQHQRQHDSIRDSIAFHIISIAEVSLMFDMRKTIAKLPLYSILPRMDFAVGISRSPAAPVPPHRTSLPCVLNNFLCEHSDFCCCSSCCDDVCVLVRLHCFWYIRHDAVHTLPIVCVCRAVAVPPKIIRDRMLEHCDSFCLAELTTKEVWLGYANGCQAGVGRGEVRRAVLVGHGWQVSKIPKYSLSAPRCMTTSPRFLVCAAAVCVGTERIQFSVNWVMLVNIAKMKSGRIVYTSPPTPPCVMNTRNPHRANSPAKLRMPFQVINSLIEWTCNHICVI